MQLHTLVAICLALLVAPFAWAQEGDALQADSEIGSGENEQRFAPESVPPEPRVSGPTSQPGVGFVGPTTPPPGSEQEEAGKEDTDATPWYLRAYEWILSLFN